MTHTTNTPTNSNADTQLFDNTFYQWLEAHGVELIGNSPTSHGTWRAMIDLNKLKAAMYALIHDKQSDTLPKAKVVEAKIEGASIAAQEINRELGLELTTNGQYYLDRHERCENCL